MRIWNFIIYYIDIANILSIAILELYFREFLDKLLDVYDNKWTASLFDLS